MVREPKETEREGRAMRLPPAQKAQAQVLFSAPLLKLLYR
jgi:hypothetical protein